jgi:hypothetical protein
LQYPILIILENGVIATLVGPEFRLAHYPVCLSLRTLSGVEGEEYAVALMFGYLFSK